MGTQFPLIFGVLQADKFILHRCNSVEKQCWSPLLMASMLLLLPRLPRLVGPPCCCRACGTHKVSRYCGDQRSRSLPAAEQCSAAGGERLR